MTRNKRKFSSYKKKSRLSRRSHKTRSKRRRLQRGKRVGRRLGSLGRRIKKIAHRISVLPTLSVRKAHFQYNGGAVGSANCWHYRVLDNMFTKFNGATSAPTFGALGWNFYDPLATAIYQIYGAYGLIDELFVFTKRKMSTMIVAPTNTPTFVEVFILKPKVAGSLNLSVGSNPLFLADMGTGANTANNAADNPGVQDPYEPFAGSGSGAGLPNNGLLAFANGEYGYNPFTDHRRMKGRWKVVKKHKFILGPNESKTIVMQSKKRYNFKPIEYYNGTSYSEGTNVSTDYYQYTPSSRVMVIRWHGSVVASSVASESGSNGQIKQATTGDPVLVRRWFEFELYKKDIARDVFAYNQPTQMIESTRSNMTAFGFNTVQNSSLFQPNVV